MRSFFLSYVVSILSNLIQVQALGAHSDRPKVLQGCNFVFSAPTRSVTSTNLHCLCVLDKQIITLQTSVLALASIITEFGIGINRIQK